MSIGEIIAWLVLGYILLWLILKVTGVINTPTLLEYSPIFGAVYLAGWQMNRLNQATLDITEIKQRIQSLEIKVANLETKVTTLDLRVIRLEKLS